jgi:hypothetical protein
VTYGWTDDEARWVPFGVGVAWLLRPPRGEVLATVPALVAGSVARLVEGRAELDQWGFEGVDLGVLKDLDTLAGLALLITCCWYGVKLCDEWRGMDDPETGEPLDPTSLADMRRALVQGPPEGGPALLEPFRAWLDGFKQQASAEERRLRAIAEWGFSGGLKACLGCEQTEEACAKRGRGSGGELCPMVANAPRSPEGIAAWTVCSERSGLWRHASTGLGSVLSGLDYTAAQTAARELLTGADGVDDRTLLAALAAVERGAVKGAQELAKAEAEAAAKAGDR